MKIKAGDLAPNVGGDLNVDLSGATVRFRMMEAHSGKMVLNTPATVDTPSTGIVHYTFTAGQTDTPGPYLYEWHVTYGGGSIQRFPQRGYLEIVIQEAVPAT